MMDSAELVFVVAAAAILSALIVQLLLPVLQRHALAHPNARSSHTKATPQGGGIAVIAATVVVGVVAVLLTGLSPEASIWVVFAAAVFVACVGAIDDVRTIEVGPRLLLQTVAVFAVLSSLPLDLRIVPLLPWWLERALLLVACLWFVNLTNFMDGIDWMTVAEFVPMSIAIALIGWFAGLPTYVAVVALAAGGALFGFAPFNRPVARIFLGDVGSLPIGLLFAWLLVLLAGHGLVAAALLLPLYYLADATITLLRRMKNGEPFWHAHRTHFYQRATDRGFSVLQIVGRVFTLNVALAVLAVITVMWPAWFVATGAVVVGATLVGCLLGSFARGLP